VRGRQKWIIRRPADSVHSIPALINRGQSSLLLRAKRRYELEQETVISYLKLVVEHSMAGKGVASVLAAAALLLIGVLASIPTGNTTRM
jgi:hypothetical protein